MKIDGGCHCGRVTYEAEIDPDKTAICHCTDCQTLSGSAFRTVVFTRVGTFKLRSGELKIYVKPERAVRSDRRRSALNAERRSTQPPLRMIPKATPSGSAPSGNAINSCQGHSFGFDQLSTGSGRSRPFRRSRSSPHSTELVLCNSGPK
jgi:hypothetical protein